ncbi:hypothetical protein M378DRAFT_865183 [Amanita muscaria Koide BX008]|uniref:Uncharacterized protein n=1 Tax=Amanita muscaria (strain Koide BX008) TaxID=946122 RepID=A0A0C2SDW3_AMAMK|nr:hypothetical protein M378DRAFT_865183 [Amanita muscaria Koide BX008]
MYTVAEFSILEFGVPSGRSVNAWLCGSENAEKSTGREERRKTRRNCCCCKTGAGTVYDEGERVRALSSWKEAAEDASTDSHASEEKKQNRGVPSWVLLMSKDVLMNVISLVLLLFHRQDHRFSSSTIYTECRIRERRETNKSSSSCSTSARSRAIEWHPR